MFPTSSTLNVDKRCKRRADCMPNHAPFDQLRTTLKGMDHDRNGCPSKEELKQAFSYIGSRYPAFQALHHAGVNNDGHLTFPAYTASEIHQAATSYKLKLQLQVVEGSIEFVIRSGIQIAAKL
ncbi:hypothetical protein V6N13_088151 [Hibiscus sabdariffa]